MVAARSTPTSKNMDFLLRQIWTSLISSNPSNWCRVRAPDTKQDLLQRSRFHRCTNYRLFDDCLTRFKLAALMLRFGSFISPTIRLTSYANGLTSTESMIRGQNLRTRHSGANQLFGLTYTKPRRFLHGFTIEGVNWAGYDKTSGKDQKH